MGGEDQAGSSGGKGDRGRGGKGLSAWHAHYPPRAGRGSQQAHMPSRGTVPKYRSMPMTLPVTPALEIRLVVASQFPEEGKYFLAGIR